MPRQNISLASQNDECLREKVKNQDFSNKSEAINYDFVRNKLGRGEKSGFAKKQTREEMLAEFKKNLDDV